MRPMVLLLLVHAVSHAAGATLTMQGQSSIEMNGAQLLAQCGLNNASWASFVSRTIFDEHDDDLNVTVSLRNVAKTCVDVPIATPCAAHTEGWPALFFCAYSGPSASVARWVAPPAAAFAAELFSPSGRFRAEESRLICPVPPYDELARLASFQFADVSITLSIFHYNAPDAPNALLIPFEGVADGDVVRFRQLSAPPPAPPPASPCSLHSPNDLYVDANVTTPLRVYHVESINGWTFPAATLKASAGWLPAAGTVGITRTYTVTAGSLPPGYSLDPASGVISSTRTVGVSVETPFDFTISGEFNGCPRSVRSYVGSFQPPLTFYSHAAFGVYPLTVPASVMIVKAWGAGGQGGAGGYSSDSSANNMGGSGGAGGSVVATLRLLRNTTFVATVRRDARARTPRRPNSQANTHSHRACTNTTGRRVAPVYPGDREHAHHRRWRARRRQR